jgi:hypothetical protein
VTEPTLRRLAWIITGVEALLLVPLIVISAANGSFSSEGGFIGTALLMMIGYGGSAGTSRLGFPITRSAG